MKRDSRMTCAALAAAFRAARGLKQHGHSRKDHHRRTAAHWIALNRCRDCGAEKEPNARGRRCRKHSAIANARQRRRKLRKAAERSAIIVCLLVAVGAAPGQHLAESQLGTSTNPILIPLTIGTFYEETPALRKDVCPSGHSIRYLRAAWTTRYDGATHTERTIESNHHRRYNRLFLGLHWLPRGNSLLDWKLSGTPLEVGTADFHTTFRCTDFNSRPYQRHFRITVADGHIDSQDADAAHRHPATIAETWLRAIFAAMTASQQNAVLDQLCRAAGGTAEDGACSVAYLHLDGTERAADLTPSTSPPPQ